MRKSERKTRSILELLAQVRTYKALDRAARKNRHYRSALKRQDKAYAALHEAGLNKKQLLIVDNAIHRHKRVQRSIRRDCLQTGFPGQ